MEQLMQFDLLAAMFNGIIDCTDTVQRWHILDYFRDLGYYCIQPFLEGQTVQRHTLCEFFNTDKDFTLDVKSTKDCSIVYGLDPIEKQISVAMLLNEFVINGCLVIAVQAFKIRKSCQQRGLGTQFFEYLFKYVKDRAEEEESYGDTLVILQVIKGKGPMGFYKKLGFGTPPDCFKSWISKQATLEKRKNIQNAIAIDSDKEDAKSEDSVDVKEPPKQKKTPEQKKTPKQKKTSSVKSAGSTARINKHCNYGNCKWKLIDGGNWTRHLKGVHKLQDAPTEGKYSKCIGKCEHCNNNDAKSVASHKDTKGKSFYICSVCNGEKRQDYIAERDPAIICKVCAKKKIQKNEASKEKVLKKRTLTESSLSYFSDPEDMIKPQVDMIKPQVGNTPQRLSQALLNDLPEEGMGIEYQQDIEIGALEQDNLDDYRDKDSDKNLSGPNKRFKTGIDIDSIAASIARKIQTTWASTAQANTTAPYQSDIQIDDQSSIVGMTSVQNIQKDQETLSSTLQIVRASKNEIVFLVDTVLQVSHLFVNVYAEQCIETNISAQLIECINKLLDRVNTLPQVQMTGILAAAFIIRQSCWLNAVTALKITSQENRESLVQKFCKYIQNTHGCITAKWFQVNWRYSTNHQTDICRHYKQNQLDAVYDVLTMSLVVQRSDIQKFVEFSQLALVSMVTQSRMLLDHIQQKPAQPFISLDDLRRLVDLMSSAKNQETIQKQEAILNQSYIVQWLEILQEAKTSINVSDVVSIQNFLDELQDKYGKLEQLDEDVTKSDDDRFSMILGSLDIIPNNKQFALAQYCVGKLYAVTRQLWVVPSGQGKSRISAGIVMVALLCGSYTKVQMVFPNIELMNRDKADFEDLFMFVTEGNMDMISYHVGTSFLPDDNALVIIDESDHFMFEDPVKFKTFVSNSSCICFTATPANGNVEEKVAAELGFQQFFYSLQDSAVIDKSGVLMVDDIVKAPSVQDKAAHIKELAKLSPVLVYCNELLTQAVIDSKVTPLMVKEGIDHILLRNLNKMDATTQLYPIVISETLIGMRGIDYRSNSSITLVLAKSFTNKRDAIQGFNRVGRFGDQCSRIRFADVEIIDKKMETAQTLALYKFVNTIKTATIVLKPIIVKKPDSKYKSKKNAKRQDMLLGK